MRRFFLSLAIIAVVASGLLIPFGDVNSNKPISLPTRASLSPTAPALASNLQPSKSFSIYSKPSELPAWMVPYGGEFWKQRPTKNPQPQQTASIGTKID